MRLFIGTRNKGKQSEFGRILGYLGRSRGIDLELVFPEDLGLEHDVRETGATFEENSRLKARAYHAWSSLPTISDDGGLEIPVLGGEPGVKSRRWLGHEAQDEELIGYALRRMAPYDGRDRQAFLRTCLTYVDGESELQECEAIRGTISPVAAERWTRGYPYRAVFVVEAFDKYYDELTPAEHRAVNHREEATTRLFEQIVQIASYRE